MGEQTQEVGEALSSLLSFSQVEGEVPQDSHCVVLLRLAGEETLHFRPLPFGCDFAGVAAFSIIRHPHWALGEVGVA